MKDGYSICFNEWALDKEIKNELGLLQIISSLCAKKGYCFASNQCLAELFDVEEETISRKIKKLEAKNYISITYKKHGCEVKEREIRLTKISIHDCQKYQSTIDQNVKENNISINNNKINEFILYSNFSENLQCECIAKSTKERCTRKSSFNINGKNCCNQHARDLIPNIFGSQKFVKPTIEEIQEYCTERGNSINAEAFYDFYESKGWYVGKKKMEDWKACVRTWERRNTSPKKSAYDKRQEMYRRIEAEYDNQGN